mgnify:CR=1 FL=1
MKILILMAFILTSATSFASQVTIDKKASTINWTGSKKIPGDNHTGTLMIKEGTIKVDEKMNLVGGTLTIDMNTLNSTDLKGEWKKKLDGHLKSDDFFAVEKHPEATFKITKVTPSGRNAFRIDGNLTLRGKTNPEHFNLTISKKDKVMVAEGKISFDRNKYGITYNSETSVIKKIAKIAKDKIINDKIDLAVKIQTTKL